MEVKNNVNNIDKKRIGNAKEMSESDILTLNKAYSCAERVPTYGGGNQQVYRTLGYNDFNNLVMQTL
jgi:hypothetical protein